MQQQPVTIDAVVQLLRDDKLRTFRIDIETDSLVEADQNAQKQHAVELLGAAGQFFSAIGPIVQAMPEAAPMFAELFKDVARKSKAPPNMEEIIEQSFDAIVQKLSQPPPPPQPDPGEMAKVEATKIQAQGDIKKTEMEIQKTQMEGHMKMQEMAMDHQLKVADHHMSRAKMQMDLAMQQHGAQMAQQQAQRDSQMADQDFARQQAQAELAQQQLAQRKEMMGGE